MNLRKIKIVKAYSLNRLVAKDEFENLIEIFVYSGFSWNVIQEFQEFNYRNLVGRKAILDCDEKKIFSEKDTKGGVQWEKIEFI